MNLEEYIQQPGIKKLRGLIPKDSIDYLLADAILFEAQIRVLTKEQSVILAQRVHAYVLRQIEVICDARDNQAITEHNVEGLSDTADQACIIVDESTTKDVNIRKAEDR